MSTTTERPNIVFIQAESMDGRKMGAMGHPAMKEATPNLDRLAEEGVLFTEAYSNSPLCVPSDSSMWSGEYVHNCEAWNNYKGLPADPHTFRTDLDKAGYRTTVIGPLDYYSGRHTIRARVSSWTRSAEIHRPVNRWPLPQVVENEEEDPRIRGDWDKTYRAMDWLNDLASEGAGNRPFALYLTTSLVHPNFSVKRRYLDLIDEEGIELPPRDESNHPVLDYQRAIKGTAEEMPDDLVFELRKIYLAMIAALDEMVGELLSSLERLGLRDSTYVIFSGDHGEMAGEHNQLRKNTLFEPSVHEPLIVSGPGVKKGAKVDLPVSLVDLYPTLMDMGGTEAGKRLDGHSLMPLLTGDEEGYGGGDWAFSEYHADRCNTGSFMVRRGPWKYVHYVGYEPRLFNLEEDPWEIRDLAEERPAVAEEMEEILREVVGDPRAIDEKVKRYDRNSFRKWRKRHKEIGDYDRLMSRIYSGWDDLCIEDVIPWTEEDEERIRGWLEEE